ncbi:MAG TPA: HEAT repeat domain-containing protein [Candidatus Polarisedimenticolaceae bacterium]|nr:HEAT repeat domain-containing protein [Candidatus Polarisedimenticolaceae bacterium]
MIRAAAVWTLFALAGAATAAPTLDDERNLFEWSSVAPMVVAGSSLGENGRYTELRVIRTLRGDPRADDVIRVDVKTANRMRDRLIEPKALRLDLGQDYVLLLEGEQRGSGRPYYTLVRGVDGALELPAEGREALLHALATFVEIQDTADDRLWWERFSRLIEDPNPALVQTALEQFVRYRRGDPQLVPALVPLLDHPKIGIRADSAKLIGQILERHPDPHAIPDDAAVRAELVARATSDEAPPVRVAAVEALARYPADLVDEVLERIARTDPEQQVRYAAELVRMEHRRNGQNR